MYLTWNAMPEGFVENEPPLRNDYGFARITDKSINNKQE